MPDLVFTKKEAIVETAKSRVWTSIGKRIKPALISGSIPAAFPRAPPRIIAEIISAEIDSKRSAH